ncbi:acetyl-CoA C-acetyltransferase [Natranaerofaba carboxydovora]|uniref:acetyl-CoA C-acetyltransferase n=1 Tax=Natranaerofaba carboxydovora TaxID=2742683 RepID=UPI003B849D99|nr:Acetyl-CoA acetyltransferase [Natranaerofaba carboxydovora]
MRVLRGILKEGIIVPQEVYIVGAKRTPVGAYGQSLSSVPATRLGELAIREALKDAGVSSSEVEETVLGCVLQAGLGQNPARKAAIDADIPVESPATTLNKVCGSGLHTINLAAQSIMIGHKDLVVAGGMENMSRAPYVLDGMRWGQRMGHGKAKDSMINEGLWCAMEDYHMGVTAENLAEKYNISREEQDEFSAKSQQKATEAIEKGLFEKETFPVELKDKKGNVSYFDTDEFPRKDVTKDKLGKLPPAFKKEGTVTAGNASGINDGAAVVILASKEKVDELGLEPIAKIVSFGSGGVEPKHMGLGPVPSVGKALKAADLELSDINVLELNEAFAAQALAVMKELNPDPEKVNLRGGAIAIGHPIGASGARIFVTLLHALQDNGGGYGLASLCIGGGQGEATIVKTL